MSELNAILDCLFEKVQKENIATYLTRGDRIKENSEKRWAVTVQITGTMAICVSNFGFKIRLIVPKSSNFEGRFWPASDDKASFLRKDYQNIFGLFSSTMRKIRKISRHKGLLEQNQNDAAFAALLDKRIALSDYSLEKNVLNKGKK